MGITFDNERQQFVFDFEHDGQGDIVRLTGDGYQVEAFGKCFYYGYEFADDVDGSVRSAFIKYVKFSEPLQAYHDLTDFIKKAVDNLSRKINLYDYNLVVRHHWETAGCLYYGRNIGVASVYYHLVECLFLFGEHILCNVVGNLVDEVRFFTVEKVHGLGYLVFQVV